MELSRAQRAVIARSTAFVLGLWIGYLALGCFRWGEHLRNDPFTHDAVTAALDRQRGSLTSSSAGRRRNAAGGAADPLLLPYTLTVGLGFASLALIGFAVLPTGVLYSIDPTPAES